MPTTNDEAKWQRARLMPVTGINGAEEEERRGTSVLLAVIESVPEFGRSLTTRFGAPGGRAQSYIECEFPQNGKTCRPDGVIRIRRGEKVWTALVEVKTRKAVLDRGQVEQYLDVASANGFDAVITISPQLADIPGGHPLFVDKKLTKKVPLHHLSWSEIHTEALIESDNHAVKDPVQAWILEEFIRYLESPKSGALEFDDMGAHWVTVRESAVRNTLRGTDPGVAEVASKFNQLVSYAGMRLSQRLGVVVKPAVSRRDVAQAAALQQQQIGEFVKTGRLSGALIVPNAVNPLSVTADLKASRVECSVSIDSAPKAKPKTRVTWLLSQLRQPPSDLMIQARVAHHELGPDFSLDKVAENPDAIVPYPKADIRQFTLSVNRSAGSKRGMGRGSFIDSLLALVDDFYEHVVQDLRSPVPDVPKVKPTSSLPSNQEVVSDGTAIGVTVPPETAEVPVPPSAGVGLPMLAGPAPREME